jgi:hypothetical protein
LYIYRYRYKLGADPKQDFAAQKRHSCSNNGTLNGSAQTHREVNDDGAAQKVGRSRQQAARETQSTVYCGGKLAASGREERAWLF